MNYLSSIGNSSGQNIESLGADGADAISGGVLPFLALAVAATCIEFSFVIDVLDGASASAWS